MLLIDFLLGHCDPQTRPEVADRLERDPSFRALHEALRRTFQALDLAPAPEPPEDLVEATLARIRRERRAEALATQRDLQRGAHRPVFSLPELGTIAAAMIVLTFVFVPSMRQARYRAILGQCAMHAGQIGTGIRSYSNASDGYLPSAPGPSRRWLPQADGQAASNSVGLFRLVRQGFAAPRTFQCPGVAGADAAGFEIEPDMTDFPSGKFINYSYQHTLAAPPLSPRDKDLIAVAATMAILADHTPVFREGRFLRSRVRALASDNHDATGQNVLYLDMHVEWRQQADAGVRGNNIYLVEGLFDYRGDEAPLHITDSFLLPAFAGKDLFLSP